MENTFGPDAVPDMVKTKQQITACVSSFPVLGCCLDLGAKNMEREKCMNKPKRFNASTRENIRSLTTQEAE
jgi:hypothetical protein